MKEIEDWFSEIMRESLHDNICGWDSYRLMPSLFYIWLASRSKNLCEKIRKYIEIALDGIVNCQTGEGWWPTDKAPKKINDISSIPSPYSYTTALSCNVILRLSREDW